MDFDDMLDEGVDLLRRRHARPRVLQRQFDLDNNDDLDRMRNCPFSLTDSDMTKWAIHVQRSSQGDGLEH